MIHTCSRQLFQLRFKVSQAKRKSERERLEGLEDLTFQLQFCSLCFELYQHIIVLCLFR